MSPGTMCMWWGYHVQSMRSEWNDKLCGLVCGVHCVEVSLISWPVSNDDVIMMSLGICLFCGRSNFFPSPLPHQPPTSHHIPSLLAFSHYVIWYSCLSPTTVSSPHTHTSSCLPLTHTLTHTQSHTHTYTHTIYVYTCIHVYIKWGHHIVSYIAPNRDDCTNITYISPGMSHTKTVNNIHSTCLLTTIFMTHSHATHIQCFWWKLYIQCIYKYITCIHIIYE